MGRFDVDGFLATLPERGVPDAQVSLYRTAVGELLTGGDTAGRFDEGELVEALGRAALAGATERRLRNLRLVGEHMISFERSRAETILGFGPVPGAAARAAAPAADAFAPPPDPPAGALDLVDVHGPVPAAPAHAIVELPAPAVPGRAPAAPAHAIVELPAAPAHAIVELPAPSPRAIVEWSAPAAHGAGTPAQVGAASPRAVVAPAAPAHAIVELPAPAAHGAIAPAPVGPAPRAIVPLPGVAHGASTPAQVSPASPRAIGGPAGSPRPVVALPGAALDAEAAPRRPARVSGQLDLGPPPLAGCICSSRQDVYLDDYAQNLWKMYLVVMGLIGVALSAVFPHLVGVVVSLGLCSFGGLIAAATVGWRCENCRRWIAGRSLDAHQRRDARTRSLIFLGITAVLVIAFIGSFRQLRAQLAEERARDRAIETLRDL